MNVTDNVFNVHGRQLPNSPLDFIVASMLSHNRPIPVLTTHNIPSRF